MTLSGVKKANMQHLNLPLDTPIPIAPMHYLDPSTGRPIHKVSYPKLFRELIYNLVKNGLSPLRVSRNIGVNSMTV